MPDQNESTHPKGSTSDRGFLASFLASLAQGLFNMLAAFSIGTGGAAIACWYYGLPMFLSLLGGILVLGLAVALTTDTWFD
jgi:hypothetical protein